MMKHLSEEQIALYAGGDLPEKQLSTATTHLAHCAECQTALDEFLAAQTFIANVRQDPSPEDLLEVRKQVVIELRQTPPRRVQWTWWLAGAAAALALLFGLKYVPQQQVRPKSIAIQSRSVEPEPTVGNIPIRPVVVPVRHTRSIRRAAGIRSLALITKDDQPAILKMTTDDPRVVILWQITERTNVE